MKHIGYFLISPKLDLVERLQKLDVRELSDLSHPVMWSGNEPDKGLLQHSDVEELVKILFLDSLRRERGPHELFNDLFPLLRPTIAYFDSLWTLNRIRLDMSIEDAVEDALLSGGLGASPSGNAKIDEFFEIVKRRGALTKMR